MKKRLQTVLAHAGVSSRRAAAEIIESGRVSVDGKAVTERGFRVDPSMHRISVNGKALSKSETKYYFLFNKPRNVISTASDTHGRKKVTDFFQHIGARLYPIGRLDKDTTGAMIITNDGRLAYTLSHPNFKVEKEYEALVKPLVKKSPLQKMSSGVFIDGHKTMPCKIDFGSGVYKIKLHEGRKRQIKKMFEQVGSKVISLKRTKYAGLSLGNLKEGEFRALNSNEVERLRKYEQIALK